MATEPAPQRAWRAACPNCGAPVEFRSAAAAYAVCSYCRSVVLREGEALRRIGQSAELFDDHSPLQIGASGSWQGRPFTLVGRLQHASQDGTWNEWHALFDAPEDGAAPRSAWLSEDNGRHVIAFDLPPPADAPARADALRVGQAVAIDGRRWSVASVVRARLIAAEGELPQAPLAQGEFAVADLRSANNEVATLDWSQRDGPPRWSVGRAVAFGELGLRGLVEGGSGQTLRGRSLACPNCGSPLQPQLDAARSITCPACGAVVDLAAAGADEPAYFIQSAGRRGASTIPLGATGLLALGDGAQPLPWQVVGYLERHDEPTDADDETSRWSEYLLYNRGAGFRFLVDAEDGWSWVAPLTGAPETSRGGDRARHAGIDYRRLYEYTARTSHVLGEFYWRVERDQRSRNTDYAGMGAAARKRLNREQGVQPGGDQEVVWSAGETLDADLLRKAFRLAPQAAPALRRGDAAPTALRRSSLLGKIYLWLFILAAVFVVLRCGNDDERCDELRTAYGAASLEYQNCLNRNRSRTGGAAFGGFSSGGFHK